MLGLFLLQMTRPQRSLSPPRTPTRRIIATQSSGFLWQAFGRAWSKSERRQGAERNRKGVRLGSGSSFLACPCIWSQMTATL